ncbi:MULTISPECIES: ion channel [Bacteria]|uniref:ion channel n=1 Tax=Bacteria TaxID=2 RepID=UPI00103929B2|nr:MULTISPECIES: ion channel [Bacteria]QDM40027.1 hypothetical protein C0V74_02410 [Altererythrobacter sp. TH136]TCJ37429.1 hypothetical protein E0504_20580 [Parafrankia sp. BMG5.11]
MGMMEQTSDTIALGKQLSAAGGLMVAMTVVHAFGITAISHLLNLREERLDELNFGIHSIIKMSAMGFMLLLLHSLEIGLFGAFYLWVGGVETVKEALFYSASTYTTLGRTAEYFPPDWRLIGAFEALIGFLLIGWSTAFIVSKANKLMPD